MGLTHEIHTSERKSFKGCRRRWDWITRQHYYPRITAKPLEFGVAYHKAMEVYYNPDFWKPEFPGNRETMAAAAIVEFVKVTEEQRANCLKALEQESLEPEAQEDYNERVELGKGMLNHYFRNVAPQVDVGFKPVKVEIKFEVPIYHPDTGEQLHCKCNECRGKYRKKFEEDPPEGWQGLPVTYAGRIDMLAEDDHGDYWIFDWKTAATLRDNDEFLYLDDQITSYCMALSLQLDLPIRGFVYVEMRKAFPQPPKENVHIRKGCKFSVSKSQATDYDTYLTHVSKHDTKAFNAGYYDDFLDWLKAEGPIFTRRYQIRKTRTELLNNMVQLGEEALDMTDPNLRVYPNSGRFSCSFCAFRQPCMGKNNGEDYEYTLDTMFDKLEHYYIRQEASTDTKGAE